MGLCPESPLSQNCGSPEAESTQATITWKFGPWVYCFHDAVEGREMKEWFLNKWGGQTEERGVYAYAGFRFSPVAEGTRDKMDGIDAGKNTGGEAG